VAERVNTDRRVRTKSSPVLGRVALDSAGMLLLLAALGGLAGVGLGWIRPPLESAPNEPSTWWQFGATVRIILSALMVVSVILGPGLLLRSWTRFSRLPLGFVPIPGIFLTMAIGGLIWATDGPFSAGTRGQILIALTLLVIAVLAAARPISVSSPEYKVLAFAGLALLVGMGRSLWSQTTPGELFAGTIGRTLEVGDRSDPRISYYLVTIISQGWNPHVSPGADLFAPWSFSDRGPLAGMFAAPILLASGAHPTLGLGDEPWSPFDGQGFMVYRLAMMGLAVCLLLAAYSLVQLACGTRIALVATAILGTTPFIIHEVYFTWPKLYAAAMCLLGTYLILAGRPILAGLMIGIGYLSHPLVLFSVPTLILLVVVTAGSVQRRRWLEATKRLGSFILGLVTVAYAWQLVNEPYYNQGKFATYLYAAAGRPDITIWTWLESRLISFANTTIPFWLPLQGAEGQPTNVWGGHSSNIVHFFFQYWNSVPFAFSIVFFPFAIMAAVRLFWCSPWMMTIVVVLPFVGFLTYWGFSDTGLLREGLHVWFISLVLLVGIEVAPRLFAGGPSALTLRTVLLIRVAECMVMIAFPTLVRSTVPGIDTGVIPVPPMLSVPVTDAIALAAMTLGFAGMAVLTYQVTSPQLSFQAVHRRQAGRWECLSARPDDLDRSTASRLHRIAPGWRRRMIASTRQERTLTD